MSNRQIPATRPILITGACGFVGRHLAASLLADEVPVIGLDRAEAVAAANAIHPLEARDLGANDNDDAPLADLLARHGARAVIHLAGQSSAGASFEDPAGTIRANLGGTLELLEAARVLAVRGAPVPTILTVGSAEEYGAAAEQGPCRETDPILPVSPYGTSKAAATLLCQQYHRSFDLPVIATRSFAHTGPGHDARFVFPSFAAQIAAIEAGRAEPVLRVGNLAAERDFLDVRDVIRAYRLLIEHGQPGEIYNVASGSSLTIADGLEILRGLSGTAITVTPDPERMRPADISRLVGDSTRLREATGWSPRFAIRETLRDLLEAARRHLV